MRDRKEVVHELFELRFQLSLLKKMDKLEKSKIEKRIMEVRTEIINIDKENLIRERGRLL